MNSYMLAYIERLHAAQVETKYLRQDIARLKGERDDIEHFLVSERELKASWAKEESSLRRKIGKLQKKMCDMVDAGKYDALVNDMRSAMEREEMAQKQLEDYTKQLEDIEKRFVYRRCAGFFPSPNSNGGPCLTMCQFVSHCTNAYYIIDTPNSNRTKKCST